MKKYMIITYALCFLAVPAAMMAKASYSLTKCPKACPPKCPAPCPPKCPKACPPKCPKCPNTCPPKCPHNS